MKINFSSKKYTLSGIALILVSNLIILFQISTNVPYFQRVFFKHFISVVCIVITILGFIVMLFGVIIKKER